MPEEFLLTSVLKPRPLHFFPERPNAVSQLILDGGIPVEILFYGEQALYQKCGFHQVRPIVISTECECLTALPVKPMRPRAVKTLSLFA